ncbi:hypothetical protein DASB73_012020 [Starmerella bacillaris]|uniref:Protein PBN1 n=1 Tax=Starmerella bacillaris TaxID=1247836 RepID=A0AAV5RF97_STABA|nr:hypothetical protein DASB73_012020 [Starmerella bacillaris]
MNDASKLRVSYYVFDDNVDEHIYVANRKLMHIEGLRASKDVRIRTQLDSAPGTFSVQWARNKEVINMPFNPPAIKSLYTEAEIGVDVEELQEWSQEVLGLPIGSLVSSSDFIALSSSFNLQEYLEEIEEVRNAVIPGANLGNDLLESFKGCDAFRVSVNATTNELIAEAWFPIDTWLETHENPTEVGIFYLEQESTTGMDMLLSGKVHKLGSFKARSGEPVMLQLYPRHRPANLKAEFSLDPVYGLHPFLNLNISGPFEPPLPVCKLLCQLNLPLDVFFDQYELQDYVDRSPRFELLKIWGETDLEKPAWAVKEGSVTLLRLHSNSTYRIPMHFRYDSPNDLLYSNNTIPAPYVFWACQDKVMPPREPEFMDVSEKIGVEAVFPSADTVFYVADSNEVPYHVPTIGLAPIDSVALQTTVAIICGALCILLSIFLKLRSEKPCCQSKNTSEKDEKSTHSSKKSKHSKPRTSETPSTPSTPRKNSNHRKQSLPSSPSSPSSSSSSSTSSPSSPSGASSSPSSRNTHT